MTRVKGGSRAHQRHVKVLKLARGYRGAKSKLYRPAHEQVMHSLAYSYAHRKDRKGDFRKLWITRINAAARMNGMSYSRFINGLNKAGVEVNRKMLSELAIHDAQGFSQLVELAKTSL
ncbi:MAG: 50S ribosomal protein L20 [Clostridiales bacterium]|nr:50S ribosomal protein L20 [Clostridiales bacterium]